MAAYIMFGKYSQDSIAKISGKRTEDALALLEKYGGTFKSGYALLGEHDLVLIAEFPSNEQAMKTSVALSKMLGIGFSTAPAVPFDDFDQLTKDL